jgi:RHS repeat-associated protein
MLDGNRYMFQGREYSTVTGLYNFRARWYAPTIGRWLSKDPIGLEGGLNLYAFCGNNAVNFMDPMGLLFVWDTSISQGDRAAIYQTVNQIKATEAGMALFNVIHKSDKSITVRARKPEEGGAGRFGVDEKGNLYISIRSDFGIGPVAHEMQHAAEHVKKCEDPADLGVKSSEDPTDKGTQIPAESRAVRASNIIRHQYFSNPKIFSRPINIPPKTTYEDFVIPQPFGTKYKP